MRKIYTLILTLLTATVAFAQDDFKLTTLQFEQLPSMNTARMSHNIFPSGDGYVVIGGHTTGFSREQSAEIFENGAWRTLPTPHYVHDGGGTVVLDDGRVLIFGGHNGSYGTGGGDTGIDVYNPSSQTFSDGGKMQHGRAFVKGVLIDGKAYISGDYWAAWYGSTPQPVEVWKGVGTNDLADIPSYSFTYHYVCPKSDGSAFLMIDNAGGWYYYGDSYDPTLLDKVSVPDGTITPIHAGIFDSWYPIGLSDYARTTDYSLGDGRYLIGCYHHKMTERYAVIIFDADSEEGDVLCELPITINDQTVRWTSEILVNHQRKEAYVVTTMGDEENYTYYIATVDYENGVVTEVSTAGGFSLRGSTAALALMPDGRILSTGGSNSNNFDAHAAVYAFAPNSGVAGSISDVPADPSPSAIYNLLGQPQEAMTRGLNIVRLSDGTTRKVFVK